MQTALKSKSTNVVDARKPLGKLSNNINNKTVSTKSVLNSKSTVTTKKTVPVKSKVTTSVPVKAPVVPAKSISSKRGRENEVASSGPLSVSIY